MEEEELQQEEVSLREAQEGFADCAVYDPAQDAEEHLQHLERQLLAFRIQIGTVTVSTLLFALMCCLIIDAVAQSHHWVYHIPMWFVNMITLAVDAGLLVFSVGILSVFTQAKFLPPSPPGAATIERKPDSKV